MGDRDPVDLKDADDEKTDSSSRSGILFLLGVVLFLSSCMPRLERKEELFGYSPSQSERMELLNYPEGTAPLNRSSDWGREILVGKAFAEEGDWYRALTSFQRARFLMRLEQSASPELEARLTWSECLIYAYAGKWHDVVTTWEHYKSDCGIITKSMNTPWFILLFTAYTYEGRQEEANFFLSLLPEEQKRSLLEWKNLSLLTYDEAIQAKNDTIEASLAHQMKSPTKARLFNACLPGLGYWYLGQKQTACTSFLLNALFLGAGIQLIQAHQPFLALITLSFELGWYVGGITGAGIEADTYNRRIKEKALLPYLRQNHGFPLLETKIGW